MRMMNFFLPRYLINYIHLQLFRTMMETKKVFLSICWWRKNLAQTSKSHIFSCEFSFVPLLSQSEAIGMKDSQIIEIERFVFIHTQSSKSCFYFCAFECGIAPTFKKNRVFTHFPSLPAYLQHIQAIDLSGSSEQPWLTKNASVRDFFVLSFPSWKKNWFQIQIGVMIWKGTVFLHVINGDDMNTELSLSILSVLCQPVLKKQETDNINDTWRTERPKFQSLTIVPNEDVNTSTSLTRIAAASDEDGDILEISYRWLDASGEVMLDDSQNYILLPETVQPTDEILRSNTIGWKYHNRTDIHYYYQHPTRSWAGYTHTKWRHFSNTEMSVQLQHMMRISRKSVSLFLGSDNEEVTLKIILKQHKLQYSLSIIWIYTTRWYSKLPSNQIKITLMESLRCNKTSAFKIPLQIWCVLLSPSTPNSQEA